MWWFIEVTGKYWPGECNKAKERNGIITISFIQPAWPDLFVLQVRSQMWSDFERLCIMQYRANYKGDQTWWVRSEEWPWWFKQTKNNKNSTLTHRPHNTKISRPLHSARSYFIKRVIKIPIVAPALLFVVCEVNILLLFDSSELQLLENSENLSEKNRAIAQSVGSLQLNKSMKSLSFGSHIIEIMTGFCQAKNFPKLVSIWS